jgi:hypothetical protein
VLESICTSLPPISPPTGAVADEDDLLAGLRVDRPLVGAEHDVHARHLGVALGVEEAQDLDRLLDRPGQPPQQ